jgi:hypothetical protein
MTVPLWVDAGDGMFYVPAEKLQDHVLVLGRDFGPKTR